MWEYEHVRANIFLFIDLSPTEKDRIYRQALAYYTMIYRQELRQRLRDVQLTGSFTFRKVGLPISTLMITLTDIEQLRRQTALFQHCSARSFLIHPYHNPHRLHYHLILLCILRLSQQLSTIHQGQGHHRPMHLLRHYHLQVSRPQPLTKIFSRTCHLATTPTLPAIPRHHVRHRVGMAQTLMHDQICTASHRSDSIVNVFF